MKKTFLIVAVFTVGILVLPVSARAEAFSIERFSSTIEVQPDSQLLVEEKIEVEFTEPRHGIFRTIPVRYTDSRGLSRSIRLVVRRVVNERNRPISYDVSRSGNDLVIKIGDPDQTVTGRAVYRIMYTVDRAILFFDDHDELYWNVTGTDWPVPVKRSAAFVDIPAPLKDVSIACFTGPAGSTESNCAQGGAENEALVVAKDFLTIVVGWPKGYVAQPTAADRVGWFLADNGIALLPAGILALLVFLWWTRGRDVRGRKTIIAEYEPPKGLTPGEVGTLLDATVHPRDFSAAVVNLAVKGYLRIIEEEKGGLIKRKNFSLQRLKPSGPELEEHEKIALDGLLPAGTERVDLSQGSGRPAFEKFSADLYAHLARQNYFVRNPRLVRLGFFAVGSLLVALGFILGDKLGLLTVVSFAVSGILFIIFAPIMPKKTKKGTLAYEAALGFKEFLTVAERYRIQWQEKERIFENYLPYAMVFGVAEQWSRALADTIKEPPSWYSGSFLSGFNAAVFASSLDSFAHSANGALAPAKGAGAGHSGFGGGGFSGGGFGGGGGGSW